MINQQKWKVPPKATPHYPNLTVFEIVCKFAMTLLEKLKAHFRYLGQEWNQKCQTVRICTYNRATVQKRAIKYKIVQVCKLKCIVQVQKCQTARTCTYSLRYNCQNSGTATHPLGKYLWKARLCHCNIEASCNSKYFQKGELDWIECQDDAASILKLIAASGSNLEGRAIRSNTLHYFW